MRKSILILIILIGFTGWSQTGRFTTVKLKNPTEKTSFADGFEWIPLMRTNGRINSFIHSDSLVVQSQIKGFALLDAQNTFKERNIFEKEIIILTNGNDNIINNNTSHNGLLTVNGGLNSNGTTTLSGTQNFSGVLTMAGVMKYDPIITNTIIDGETDDVIINKRWFNANLPDLQQVTDKGSTTTNTITVGTPTSFQSTISASSFGTLNSINNERSAYGSNFMQFTNASSPTNAFIVSMPGATDMNSGFRTVNFRYLDGTVAYLNDIPTLQAGTNITIDNTDPLNPIINSTGSGGGGSNTYSNGLTLTGSDVEIGGLLNPGITNISITDPTTLFVIGGDVSNPVANPTNVTVGQNQVQLNSSTTLSLNAPSGININNTSNFNGIMNIDDFLDFRNGSTSTKMLFPGNASIVSTTSQPLQISAGNNDLVLTQATFNASNSVITRSYYENNMTLRNFPTLGNFFLQHNSSQGNFLPSNAISNLGNGSIIFASYDDTGSSITANGDYAVVMGRETRANALSSMAVGAFNSQQGSSKTTYNENDMAFVVGIGESETQRKDGIVVKKNGVILAPELTTAEIDARILNTTEDKTLIHIEYLKERFGLTNPGFDPNVVNLNKNIWANQLRISASTPPSSATDTGIAGQITWDADFIYICVATNTWKRVAVSTW